MVIVSMSSLKSKMKNVLNNYMSGYTHINPSSVLKKYDIFINY